MSFKTRVVINRCHLKQGRIKSFKTRQNMFKSIRMFSCSHVIILIRHLALWFRFVFHLLDLEDLTCPLTQFTIVRSVQKQLRVNSIMLFVWSVRSKCIVSVIMRVWVAVTGQGFARRLLAPRAKQEVEVEI